MKFGMIGSHSSGKTTTIAYTLQYLKSKGIEDVMIRSESARRCPYPINKKGRFKSQFWMLTEMIRNELDFAEKTSHLLCDRTVIDVLVYSLDAYGHKRLTKAEVTMINNVVKDWLRVAPYDYVYLFSPLKLVPDSLRPLDSTWQQTIWQLFKMCTKDRLGVHGFIPIDGKDLQLRKNIVAMDILAKIRNKGGLPL